LPKEITEYQELQDKKPQVSKVSNEELLTLLSAKMYTTKEVAQYLKVENGTAFSRLKRLEKNGVVTRRWEGNRSWWVACEAVGIEVPETPAEEEGVESA